MILHFEAFTAEKYFFVRIDLNGSVYQIIKCIFHPQDSKAFVENKVISIHFFPLVPAGFNIF